MTILPLPLPQSAVPALSPTSAAAPSIICAAVSHSIGTALLSPQRWGCFVVLAAAGR